jgi:hypothetical protein
MKPGWREYTRAPTPMRVIPGQNEAGRTQAEKIETPQGEF